MMLVRQLAHLNFGMPRVRSHGRAPFVAARDDRGERSDKKEAGTKKRKKKKGEKRERKKEKKIRDRDRIGQGDRENGVYLLPVLRHCLLFLGGREPLQL